MLTFTFYIKYTNIRQLRRVDSCTCTCTSLEGFVAVGGGNGVVGVKKLPRVLHFSFFLQPDTFRATEASTLGHGSESRVCGGRGEVKCTMYE